MVSSGYHSSIEETEEKTESEETKKNVKNVVDTWTGALFLENLFGIFRFRMSKGELVPVSKKMKALCVTVAISYCVLFFLLILLSPTAALTGTGKLVDMAEELPSIVVLTQYVLSAICTSFLLSEKNIKIATTVAGLDCKLHINTDQEFYKGSSTITNRLLFVLMSVHVLVSAINMLTDDDIGMSRIIIFPIYIQQSLEISVFCLMILGLRKRLICINKYLTKFINEKDSGKSSVFIVSEKKGGPSEYNFIGRASPDNMKIRDLAVTYDIIGETCDLISDVFNFQIFMTLVATFTYIVITIWSSLYYYKNDGENSVSLANIIIWCITNIFIVAFMSLTCEKLLLTRIDTKIYVNKIIMDYDLPKSMRVQAKAFMELIEAWPLRIFIFDMFSVDITLMLKYISVATTYLIVIIQISHFT